MQKIEHIGIAVKDLKKGNELYKKLLGKAHYKIEKLPNLIAQLQNLSRRGEKVFITLPMQ